MTTPPGSDHRVIVKVHIKAADALRRPSLTPLAKFHLLISPSANIRELCMQGLARYRQKVPSLSTFAVAAVQDDDGNEFDLDTPVALVLNETISIVRASEALIRLRQCVLIHHIATEPASRSPTDSRMVIPDSQVCSPARPRVSKSVS